MVRHGCRDRPIRPVGALAGGRRELDALAADWDEAQIYLHIVVHHSTLGEVQTLLTRCRTLCDTGDSQALLPELAELQCQLDALDALERISVRNIL